MDDLAAEPVTLRFVLTDAQRQLIEAAREPLRRLAVQIARKYGGDAHELQQVAMEIACKRVGEYLPERAAFLTFVWDDVRFALIKACKRERQTQALQRTIARGAARILASLGDDETTDDLLEDRQTKAVRAAAAEIVGSALAFYPDSATPEDELISAEQRAYFRQRIDAALATLEEVDRRIVVRHLVDEVPLAEVQRELGIAKYSEARRRLHDAAERLARRLGSLR